MFYYFLILIKIKLNEYLSFILYIWVYKIMKNNNNYI